jgi:hypothetical protein
MILRHRFFGAVVVAIVLFATAGTAAAARARFHYVPADANGRMTLDAASIVGPRLSLFGGAQPAEAVPPRPNRLASFRHPCTGRFVTVPLALPEGTPTIEYRGQRVIYNYGSYTVEIQFLPDGSVDVVYNSGLLRAL